jgi:hypothetical protein
MAGIALRVAGNLAVVTGTGLVILLQKAFLNQ